MVPGVVPGALLVARTDAHAVLINGLLVYPTGFDFDLAVRRHPGFPGHPRRHRDRGHVWGDELRLEVRFADGRRADNGPGPWPRPSGDQPPDPPLLYQSTSGPDGGHVCRWPASQLPTSSVEIDAGLVVEAGSSRACLAGRLGTRPSLARQPVQPRALNRP